MFFPTTFTLYNQPYYNLPQIQPKKMIPKRKLIKKQRPKPSLILEQTQAENHQSIIQKLKSVNTSFKQEAVTILANLHICMPYFLEPEFSRELINLLYQGNNSLVCQTIFAIGNLCEIEPPMTRLLFKQGLDKALMTLPSTSNELLKPILILFITVCQSLPKKYHYLLQGIRSSLSMEHMKQSPQLCLEFLFRTSNQSTQKLSEPIINSIIDIYKSTESIPEKSYAVAVIGRELEGNKEVEEILVNYMTELLVCIDLGKEYEMNFTKKAQTSTINKGLEHAQKMNEAEQEQMQEDQGENHQKRLEKVKKFVLSAGDREKLKFFNQTINGIEIVLEFILDVLENDEWDEDEDDQQENDGEAQMAEEQMNNNVQKGSINIDSGSTLKLKQLILEFIRQNMGIFPKFLSLSSATVPDSQNIVYLFYHLLMHIDKHIQLSSASNQSVQNLTQINQLVQASLQNLFASIESSRSQDQETSISFQQYQTLVQCLEIGLGLLMKNKGVAVGEEWLIGFGKGYMMAGDIFKSVKLLEQIKPCWMIMLQLYSKVLNPQKNPNVTYQQNYNIGQVLKQLIVCLPYNQLQQFRCQVIDTIFDVYSNEKFDQTFVQLGYFELLQTIVKKGQAAKGHGKKGDRKKEKFVTDVLKDIKRFLDYKHKMINK